MSFFDDAVSVIGQGLAKTAINDFSDMTGYDIGGTLNFLFGDNQTTGGQNLEALSNSLKSEFTGSSDQLSFLNNTLTQQGQMIVDLGTQLSSVSQSINAISIEISKIETLLQQINSLQLYNNWQTLDVQVQVYVNAINTAYQTYSQYIENYDSTPTTEVNILITDILNSNNGPKDGLNGISNFILDNGMQKGVLQLWSDMVCALINSGVMDYREAVQQYKNYYKKLVFAQLTATNLLMEAYKFNGDGTSCSQAYTDYKNIILSQENTFIQWLMPMFASGSVAPIENEYVNGSQYSFSCYNAAADINPSFTCLENYIEYYSPSNLLYSVEKMLSSLYNNDIDDRRMVVYMAYTNTMSVAIPAEYNISLKSTNNTIIIPSNTGSTMIGSYKFPTPIGVQSNSISYPDGNFNFNNQGVSVPPNGGFILQRFIFSAGEQQTPIDGSYQIYNNLPPIQSYLQGGGNPNYGSGIPLLPNSVSNYTLTIDETSNFDFMNFMAYSIPFVNFWQGPYY